MRRKISIQVPQSQSQVAQPWNRQLTGKLASGLIAPAPTCICSDLGRQLIGGCHQFDIASAEENGEPLFQGRAGGGGVHVQGCVRFNAPPPPKRMGGQL